MTPMEIQTVAQNAGFTGEDLATAVAIAQAESSGDPGQYNPESAFFSEHQISSNRSADRGSYGLWQIFRFLHPEFDGWNLSDPQVNACAANIVYVRAGKKFGAWSTYNSGRFRAFLVNSSGSSEA